MKQIFLLTIACSIGLATAANRYEAESAIVDANSVVVVSDANASGGSYVSMQNGDLSFKVTAASAGYYTLWVSYSQPNDTNGKIQNLTVNSSTIGQASFPYTKDFVSIKGSAKIKLAAGANTIGITKSWGYVNIDYIELTPYVATPFTFGNGLVTPNASDNAKKMFGFLYEHFQKNIVSGVMTNTVMQNDGKYTPDSVENQTEVAWIIAASGKTPALLGTDFIHGVGLNSDGDWYKGYTNATLSLAQNIYAKGGFPAYCWHWQDPSHAVEAFYTLSSGNTPYTTFDLNKAFLDSTTHAAFDTTSAEYIGIVRDLDIVAGYLKTLADKGVPVLWRPLHEASGKWFWWGSSGPDACKALYHLMFDRFTKVHGLNNLIWVWTTDEAGDALNWYPGDAYVDIIARDYYFDPRQTTNHSSLVSSFEKVKDIFSAKKLITLGENGAVPYPDSLVNDSAGWSYFMSWYGDYTMDGWAHDNTAADWKAIMNHNYVITLDKMPGWANYTPPVSIRKTLHTEGTSISFGNGSLEFIQNISGATSIDLFDTKGSHVATLLQGNLAAGSYSLNLKRYSSGMYLVRVRNPSGITTQPIVVDK